MRRYSRFDEFFTALFMVAAIGAVVCYFTFRDNPAYLILGGIAVLIRIAQYIKRFL